MKKIFIGMGIFICICVFGLCGYVVWLRVLALEGNRIFEKRCVGVNPHLISYKKIFLLFADQANNPDWASGEQMVSLMESYIEHMRIYADAETKWLDEDRRFINRWDFQLLEPWYMKKAGQLQLSMYEGYRDDALNLLNIWDHPETLTSIPDPDYVSEPRQRRDAYSQEYFDFFEEASLINDWRKFFVSVPVPKGCTSENLTIPDTSGAIEWHKGDEATPSGVPIDPYATS